jgi:hypothetical protein
MDYGQSTAARQDLADPNTIVEGTAVKRVKMGAGSGPGVDYVTLGGAWYIQVCTGVAGEKFYGLAVSTVDPDHSVGVWHEGIRKALPDLNEEGVPVDIQKDDPLTNIGVLIPGTVRVWVALVNTADELIGYCERPVEIDDASIRVRLGTK